MGLKINIERLVVDEGVLAAGDREAFQGALAEELGLLRSDGLRREPPPAGAVRTLARQAAASIQARLPSTPTFSGAHAPAKGPGR